MQRPDQYQLTLFNMSAKDCLAFLEAIQTVAFNYVWRLNGLISEKATHNINLELAGTLDEARTILSQVASSQKLPDNSWRLLPINL